MLKKIIVLFSTLLIVSCTQSTQKQKIVVAPELMEPCPHLVFSYVTEDNALWNTFIAMSNQYAKCSKQIELLQKTIKEYNK